MLLFGCQAIRANPTWVGLLTSAFPEQFFISWAEFVSFSFCHSGQKDYILAGDLTLADALLCVFQQ